MSDETMTERPQFRMTGPRRVILSCLKEAESYRTADDIFMELHETQPGISLATIYRTLNLLEEHHMISKVNVGDGKAHFAYVETSDEVTSYHQLICTNCFKIIKFNDFTEQELCNMRGCEEKYSNRFNFAISSHIVQYYGICSDCQKLLEEEQTTRD